MDEQVRLLFRALTDLPPEQRERYLNEHAVPAAVRSEVVSLLGFDESETLFTASIAASMSDWHKETEEAADTQRCGPYRLLRLLGQGGMGSVYLAERADGEVQQRVAIKLVKRGYDTAFRERFLRERQILARLEHPSIARLIAAGHTQDGNPYLAMEYVNGEAIDTYANRLDTNGKLEIFLQVCDAVSYAHRNLIIHRDLKPSNILVDQEGRPRLLDFGIAKILDSENAFDATATAQVLTPQFASPEQIRGEAITTATDVYGLGLVLYQLLTGRLPYQTNAVNAAALARIICEVEPGLPGINGDLDNILLMALRKEPARRYASVQHFADDLKRVLRDRPILARPDTLGYRLSKFVKRNVWAVSAAAVALAAIVIGLGAALYQERIAQERFQQLRKLAHTFVFDVHDEIAQVQGTTKARELVVRTGLEYLDALAANAGRDRALQAEVAAGYLKMGIAQGMPTRPNLGRLDDALASYRKAGKIYQSLASSDAAYLPNLARYYQEFGSLIRFKDPEQYRPNLELSIRTYERIAASTGFTPAQQGDYTKASCFIGDADEDLGNYRLAWTEYLRCRQLAHARLTRKRDRDELMLIAGAGERIGTGARDVGLLAEALRGLDEEENAANELLASEPLNPLARRLKMLAHQFKSIVYFDDHYPNLADPGRGLETAKVYLNEAQDMIRRDPNDTSAKVSRAIAMCRVSLPLREFSAREAVTMARESVRAFDDLIATSGKSSIVIVSNRVLALQRLAAAEVKAGQASEARRVAEPNLAAERTLVKEREPDPGTVVSLVENSLVTGDANAAAGDAKRAETLYREACDLAAKLAARQELPGVLALAKSQQRLGDLYVRLNKSDGARTWYRRSIQLWRDYPDKNSYVTQQETRAEKLLAAVK